MRAFSHFIAESKSAPPGTGKFNRGDVAEGILGAGVAARFAARPASDVTVKDINTILDKTLTSNNVLVTKVKDVDVNKAAVKITDNIEFRIALPQPSFQFLQNRKNRETVSDLFSSVLAFVNSDRRLELQSKILARNLKHNEIIVSSDGTGDQKGTKADIKLVVDGKRTKNQISLKVSGGDQFAQVFGATFEKQRYLWDELLGLDIGSLEKKYNTAAKNYDPSLTFGSRDDEGIQQQGKIIVNAIAIVYKAASKQLAGRLSGNKKEAAFVERFIQFVKNGATKGDEDVELLKLEKGGFKRIRFDKVFDERIRQIDFGVNFKQTGKFPIIEITDTESGSLFVRIRLRQDNARKSGGFGVRIRNLVESGPLLFSLFSDRGLKKSAKKT